MTIIDKPVEGVKTDARPHPAGRKGAMLSLDEVAERAWKARMSPRLRAWVTQQLVKCGVQTGSRRQKMQCVLDAFRAKTFYIHDPVMGEFMANPDQILCLDDGGLCIPGFDCDEATITLDASALCIGIPAMVIGSAHKEPISVPTHVFGAFQDEQGDWVKMDGTTKHPVGTTAPHLREWWVEPGEKAKNVGEGDFVGMSGAGIVGVGVGDGDDSDADVGVGRQPSVLDLRYPGLR